MFCLKSTLQPIAGWSLSVTVWTRLRILIFCKRSGAGAKRGVSISILNRHEASWRSLPSLLQLGVEVVLGGDWTYFWGDPASQQDMAWGRIAALCTRDPTQSTVGLTEEEDAVTRGFLKTVYDTAHQPASNTEEWAALRATDSRSH